jgi:hypothetical protein
VVISTIEREIPEKESKTEEKQVIQIVPEKAECKHYFGYLSQRSSKEGVPEECIICEKIVQYMLKTVTE